MSSVMPLGGVIFIAIFMAILGYGILMGVRALGRRNTQSSDRVKYESYECGIPVQEKADTKISVKFYLTAILFIVFDIEIIFMYPWATTFRESLQGDQGPVMLISMLVFLAIFIFGLIWEIKSRALEWD